MKNKFKYLIFIFVCFISFIPSSYAYVSKNTNTYFELTPYDVSDKLESVTCGNENLYNYLIDFVNNFDSENSNYYMIISNERLLENSNSADVRVSIIPKSVNFSYQWIAGGIGLNSNSYISYSDRVYSSSSFKIFNFGFKVFPTCSNDYSSYSVLDDLIDYLNNGTIPDNYHFSSNDITTFGTWFSNFNGSSPYYTWLANETGYERISGSYNNYNNSDLPLNNVLIPFYSSSPLIFGDSNSLYYGNDSIKWYLKSFKFNDYNIEVNPGDSFPTYSDLFGLFPESSNFIEYKSSLGTIYTSFSPSVINNFNLDISFNTHNVTALEYNNNLDYTWNCYGRINNNNNYYSYVQFPYCDFENNGVFTSDSDLLNVKLNNFNIYDSNDNIISDFSSYDKLFFYIDFQYKNYDLNRVVSNLNIRFTGNSYYSDDFIGPIYENFINLPVGFKLLFSTNKNDYSNFFGKYVPQTTGSLFSIYRQEYNTSTLNTNSIYGWLTGSFIRYTVNNKLNTGLMFYQKTNSLDDSTLYSLEFVIFPDIIISLRNNESNDFYYSNSSGTIVNNTFTIDYSNISSDSYDLSYYLGQVNSFIDDLTSSSLQFSNITQQFYDSMPAIFQNFIFIIFILFCVYFTFLLIKRK